MIGEGEDAEVGRAEEIALDAFDLIAPLGAGGMGVVWRARHRAQGAEVAIKVIGASWSENPRSQAAFRREVRAIAGLTHPGIVAVHDVGAVPGAAAAASGGRLIAGSPYLAMELLARGSLERLVGALEWPLLRQLLADVLDALAHAHAHGIVHCDIKPANILLSEGPGDRVSAKLTDFGVAQAFTGGDEDGERPMSAGTPAYMPPEQLCGRWRELGPWTDLYALGVTIWELCCGRLPFAAGDLGQLIDDHLHRPPPAFFPLFQAPPALEGWLRRLLAKGIDERFACVADAAWALRRLERGKPRPPTITWAEVDARRPGAASSDPEGATAVVPERRLSTVDIGAATTMASDRLPSGERPGAGGRSGRGPAASERPPWPLDWRSAADDEVGGLLGGAGLGLFGLRAIPLVDRGDERDLLWNALATVHAHGETRVLVVRGPSGVGKSRLVEWLAIRAHEAGAADVLKATHAPISGPEDGVEAMLARALRAQGLAGEELFDHLHEVAQRLRPRAEPEALRERVAAIAALIAPGVPPPSAAWPRVAFADDRERQRVISEVLGDLAAARPLLVWLDDAMWGPASLTLARRLVEARGRRLPALVVVTIRDEHRGDVAQAGRLLAELEALPAAVDVVKVAPLRTIDHRRLVGRLLGFEGELVDAIVERTLGNPMFAVQLVGDWVERGLLVPTPAGFRLREGAPIALPDDLHELWTRRIERLLCEVDPALQGEGQRALELAAALGANVDLEEWREVCGLAGVRADERWIDRLYAQRLAIAGPRGFTFVHGMLRESLERMAAEAGRRVDHHRACAAMLAERHADHPLIYAERLARHRIAAGEGEAAIEPLLDACYRLQLAGAYQRAEAILDMLGALADDLGLDADDPRRLRAAAQGAWLAWMRGSSDEVARSREVADLEDRARRIGADAIVGDLLRLRGLAARFAGDHETSLGLLEDALARCERAGDREGAARASLALAATLRAIGRLDEAEANLACAVAEAEALGLDALLPRCYGNLAEIALSRDRWAEAHRWFDLARDAAEIAGDRKALAFTHGGLGDLAVDEGNLDAALAHYRRAETLFAAAGSRYVHGVRLNAALASLLRGRAAAAQRIFREHLAREGGRDRLLDAQAHLGLALLAAGEGAWAGDEGWDGEVEAAARALAGRHEIRGILLLLIDRAAEVAEAAGERERARSVRALAG